MLTLLLGCNLLPPLTLHDVVVRDLTYDRLDADLAFLVDDSRDPEGIDGMSYAVSVEGAQVDDGGSEDTEIDGDVILAPISVQGGAVPGWADLVGRDDEVPFEVTGSYEYSSLFAHVSYTIIERGTLPAPHAPEIDPIRISASDAALRLRVVNRDPTAIELDLGDLLVAVDGGEVPIGGAIPPLHVPGDGAGEMIVPLARIEPGWGEAVEVALEADALVETDFGPIPYPIDLAWRGVPVGP